MDILSRVLAEDKRRRSERWKGTFKEYLEIVRKTPSVADLAHARVAKAVERFGKDYDAERGIYTYNYFRSHIYGADEAIDQIMAYFRGAAEGLDIRKRMLLLLGPPGAAKSEFVALMKRALESYSHTEEGAVYSISGCPMHEEPLHLIPETVRPEVERELGVKIEGDLCPQCAYRLQNEWSSIMDVPVERVFISEANRVGIGSFAPGDPKVVSLEDLVGSVDLVKVSQYGSESHPLSYNFDGALEAANRGIYEAIEVFKQDPTLLFPLITLLQEKQIKAGRFALFYADEAVISHTNLSEYERFAGDGRNEAIQNRTHVVKVPYVLVVEDEVRIYRKLFPKDSGIHIAPHAFEMAALFAVASRFVDLPKGLSRVAKAKLYNGEGSAKYSPEEVRQMRKTSFEKDEGMSGIGPRQVVSALSQAAVSSTVPCLTPVEALRALVMLPQHIVGGLGNKDVDVDSLLGEVMDEYTTKATKDVQKAYIEDFEAGAQTLLQNYLDNAQASVNKTKLLHPIMQTPIDPDEQLMKEIESRAEISGTTDATEFRREILARVGTLARRGETFRWDSHPKLKEAIEKKLFDDLSGTLKVTLTTPTPDKTQREKIDSVRKRLVEKYGYCEHCADALLKYVGYILRR